MVNMKESYKHLLNYTANLITLLVEGALFGLVWYCYYSRITIMETDIIANFHQRGNWAVIGMYVLILFFFTQVFGGYKIGYLRVGDIILSNILALFLGNIVAYLELVLITRTYANPWPLAAVFAAECALITMWTLLVRVAYKRLYPPRDMLVVYGRYAPDDLIDKINSRKDKYNICETVSCTVGYRKLFELMEHYPTVVLCDLPAETRNDLMKFCYQQSIRVYCTPKLTDIMFRGADDVHLFDTPLYVFRNQGLTIDQRFFKRLFDIVFSIIGIIIASPFMIVIALCIKLYDGGPVFYTQERYTRDNRIFRIIKFRSMRVDSDKAEQRITGKKDSRVTPIGNVIRNIHFDELPQLFNILIGDMSIVGPRPEWRVTTEKYCEEIPEFPFRLKVKAGLTGYAQVWGKYNTTPYDKLKLDMTYIENYSLWLDLKILMLTFKVLFMKENTEGVDETQTTALKQ
jgi:exopolysaccharide biosynthesis polyprenyl glycosylphosphotransferase